MFPLQNILAESSHPHCGILNKKVLRWVLPISRRYSSLEIDQLVLSCNLSNAIGVLSYSYTDNRYSGLSSSAANIDFSLNSNRILSRIQFIELFPIGLQSQMWSWQRTMIKGYFSILRNLDSFNPAPGLTYFATSRSPAFPFIYMSAINDTAYLIKTIPFMDDENIKIETIGSRSYALGIVLTLY